MKITILEPFFTGSHKQWAKGYQQYAKLKSLKGVADYEVYRNSPKSVAEEELLTSIILPVKS